MSSSVTSDKDYLKIFDDGPITVSTVGGGDADADLLAVESGSETITHNIEDVPMVRAFYDPEDNGMWYDSPADGDNFATCWLTLSSTTTTTKLIINSLDPQTDIPVFYRIYDLGDRSFTSDDRIDKIFRKDDDLSDTVDAAADSASPETTTITIPHGQGEVVNWTLQFSEDGSTWSNGGSRLNGAPDTTSGPPGGPYSFNFYTIAYGKCDDTNFYIVLRSNYDSEKTIFLRYALDYRA